eukprot:scaffold9397_cov148-Isochrysis_galbana.AAC.1
MQQRRGAVAPPRRCTRTPLDARCTMTTELTHPTTQNASGAAQRCPASAWCVIRERLALTAKPPQSWTPTLGRPFIANFPPGLSV